MDDQIDTAEGFSTVTRDGREVTIKVICKTEYEAMISYDRLLQDIQTRGTLEFSLSDVSKLNLAAE
jgi:hypothetical protein